MKKLLLLILLSVFLANPLWATTYYVTKGGSGSTCSVGSPCLTIATGLSKLAAGDTLDIAVGTYAENISSPVSGTDDSHRTTIQGHPGDTVIVNAIDIYSRNFITIKNLTSQNNVCHIGRSAVGNAASTYITFDTVIQHGWVGGGGGGGGIMPGFRQESVDGTNLVLIHCTTYSDGSTTLDHGVYVSGRGVVIDDLNSYGNRGHGVQIYSNTAGATNGTIVRNSRLHDNGSFGLGMYSGNNIVGYNNLIYGNGILTSGSGGARIQSGSGALFYNNTLYNNTGYGLRLESSAVSPTAKNNISFSNSGAEISNASASLTYSNNLCDAATAPCTLAGNPLFGNPGANNFALQPGSPAINAGASLGSPYNVDFLGVTRADGTTTGDAYDIGAYEYQSPPASISIVTPNGGETWESGSNQTISWSTVGNTETIDVFLSRIGDFSDGETLFAGITDDGSEPWTVSGAQSSTAKVRVRLHTTTWIYSTSANPFTITSGVPKTITVTAPPLGLHVFPTGSLQITWDYTGLSGNAKIELSRDDQVTWETVIASIPISQLAYSYTVPAGAAYSACVVKVSSLQDPSIFGISSAVRIGGKYLLIR